MARRMLLVILAFFPIGLYAETVKLPVTADAGVSSERGHKAENSGASVTVPIRQNQNWSGFETKACLMGFDTQPIRGWTVSQAWLNIFLARGDLYGIGLCTVLAGWDEGAGLNGQTGRGGASWSWAREPEKGEKPGPDNYWAWPESGIYSVSWAHPDARYHHAGPGSIQKTELEEGRIVHLRFPVDPALVEALATGLASGLILTDDKGQVAEGLSLKGKGTPYRYDRSQDIYMYTRDIQEPSLRPFLEVEGSPVDQTPPGAPGSLVQVAVEPFDPSVTVTFSTPADDGTSGGPVLGYEVRYSAKRIVESAWESLERIPLWAVPKPLVPDASQRMRVFTLPSGRYFLAVRAVDEAGNLGPISQTEITIPQVPRVSLPEVAARAKKGDLGKAVFDNLLELWACPDLCKVDPVSGGILLDGENYEPAGDYKLENQVWSSSRRTVNLEAARGEVLAFQVILGRVSEKTLSQVRVSVSDLVGEAGRLRSWKDASVYRIWYLDVAPRKQELTGPWELIVDKGHRAAWHGDACLPLSTPYETSFTLPTKDNMGDDQHWQSVWIDLSVPGSAKPGLYRGEVTVNARELKRPAAVKVELQVLPLRIPDEISWPAELNGYSSGPANFTGTGNAGIERYIKAERRLHQLAHSHRTTLNVLPYGQAGNVPPGGWAPSLAGSGKDTRIDSWQQWEQRFGPYLTGQAFTSSMGYRGPREGVPITHIYLPIHENWPIPLQEHYADFKDIKKRLEFVEWAKTSRPLDEAFSQDYKDGFSSVVRQMFEHFKQKGYTRTAFQVYCNNKYYYKTDFFGPRGRGGSSFWLLDEPVDYDDYEANRFFLQLVKDGYDQAGAPQVKIDYRTDVSQPEMSRGLWDGLCNMWNSSGLMDFAATAMFRMTRLPQEKYWRYGGETRISGKLINYQQNFLAVWSIGAAGVLPCWNVFGGGDWFRPNNLSIIYTGKNYARTGKSFERAFAGVRLKAIRRAQQDVEYLNLLAAKKGWSREKVLRAVAPWADDAGAAHLTFSNLTAERLFELRRAVAAALQAP